MWISLWENKKMLNNLTPESLPTGAMINKSQKEYDSRVKKWLRQIQCPGNKIRLAKIWKRVNDEELKIECNVYLLTNP